MIDQIKKVIESVLNDEIDIAWGDEIREAVKDHHNCTQIAAYVVHLIDAARQNGGHEPAAMLVHGIVENSEYDTPKFHAWAEIEDTVVDLTLPPPVRFTSRDRYYTFKGIETTRRYSPEEISINVVRIGHYGPWDDVAFADQSLFR